MPAERTLSIIKPDAVAGGQAGRIVARFYEEGLRVVAMRMVWMSRAEAEGFYAVHRGTHFFQDLVTFMSSGPSVVMVLEGRDAIRRNREIMGATSPDHAAPGTLRALYGTDVGRNAVHGSDGPDTARTEIAWFFRGTEIHSPPD